MDGGDGFGFRVGPTNVCVCVSRRSIAIRKAQYMGRLGNINNCKIVGDVTACFGDERSA